MSCVSRFLTAGMFPQLVAAVRWRVSLASMILSMAYAPHVDELVRSPIEITAMDDVIFGRLLYVSRQMGYSFQFGLGLCMEFCLVRFNPSSGRVRIRGGFGW